MVIFCSSTRRSFDQKVSNDLISFRLPHPIKVIALRVCVFVFSLDLIRNYFLWLTKSETEAQDVKEIGDRKLTHK